jgi:hypothetical protein
MNWLKVWKLFRPVLQLIDEHLDINPHPELKDNFGKPLLEDFVKFRLSDNGWFNFVRYSMISKSDLSKLI